MNHKNKKAMENWSETKPDGWLLTEIEEKAALEAAGIVKQSRVDYLASLHPNLPKQSPELTDDEAMVALIRANKLKETQLEWNRIASERRKIEREAGEALLREWNYERFYREMKSKAWEVAKPEIREDGRFFIYNQNTAPLIKTICFKLSRDPRYETEMGFKFSNGLIIRGEYGAGKSFIPGLVAKNPVCPVQIISTHQANDSLLKTGSFHGISFSAYDLIMIDDLGAEEPEVNVYGTKMTWFRTFFETLYSRDKNSMARLIITTNLSFSEIGERYGDRVRDRMKEFDVLDVIIDKSMRHN